LARWLGPVTSAPPGIERAEITVPHTTPFRGYVYRRSQGPLLGSVLVAPGLHFAGPADPRFDRFCRVLARSGALVLAPFLPTYLQMDVTPGAIEELSAALDVLLALPDRPARKPSVFSISFGSMPALRLAGLRGRELSSVVVFGGFSGFERTLRFALAGDGAFGREGRRKHDPLNAPVVVQNLLRFVTPTLDPAQTAALRAAFRTYCMATWGTPEMKVDRGFEGPARAIAASLEEPVRGIFLKATRVEPGVEQMVNDALRRSAGAFDWMDPAPHLGRLPISVTVVHGRDDDVIPFEESVALEAGLRAAGTDVRLFLTGMFGHTGKASLGELLERASEGADELRSVIAMLRALASL